MSLFVYFLLVVVLPASVIFNILLLIRGLNIVKQNEQLVDVVNEYDLRQFETSQKLETMLQTMKDIDSSGAFESDDEVGSVFNQLKETIEIYKKEI
jgi:hypothetical protein